MTNSFSEKQRLADCGWEGWVRLSGQFFLYGSVTRIAGSPPLAARRRMAQS